MLLLLPGTKTLQITYANLLHIYVGLKNFFLRRQYKIWLNYIAGPLLFVILSIGIYFKVKDQSGLQQSKGMLQNALSGNNLFLIFLLLLLMFLNWGIEARKWYVLVKRIQQINFFTACKAILSGVAFSFVIPNGIGDYAGRIAYMSEGNRLRSVTLTLVGSMAQLIVTLTGGFFALLYLNGGVWAQSAAQEGLSGFWINIVLFLVGAGALLMLVIYFKLSWLTIMFEKIPLVHKYRFMVENLESINTVDLTRILSLSVTRYMVFIVQYLIMLHIFSVQVNWIDATCTVCILFLVLAILPTVPVADLGMRGFAGLQLFGIITANKLGIIATTSGIWLLNLVVPAVAGSLFILGIKLFRNR